MVTQWKWRVIGVVCLIVCVLLAVMSTFVVSPGVSVLFLIIYWGLFTALMLVALYIALLDIRYTRMRYKLAERVLFHDAFMTPEFRDAMKNAVTEQGRKEQEGEN